MQDNRPQIGHFVLYVCDKIVLAFALALLLQWTLGLVSVAYESIGSKFEVDPQVMSKSQNMIECFHSRINYT